MGNKQSHQDDYGHEELHENDEYDLFPRPRGQQQQTRGGGYSPVNQNQHSDAYGDHEDEGFLHHCCECLLRCQFKLFVILSALFVLLLGLLMTSWSMYANFASESFKAFSDMSWDNSYPLEPAMWGFLAIGVCTVIAAVLGIVGAWRENKGCLGIYACFAILFGILFFVFGPLVYWGSSSVTPSVYRTVNEICQNAVATQLKLGCVTAVPGPAAGVAAVIPSVAPISPLTQRRLRDDATDTLALVLAGYSPWIGRAAMGHNATSIQSASLGLSRRLLESHDAVSTFLFDLGPEKGCPMLASLCALPEGFDANTACTCNGMEKPLISPPTLAPSVAVATPAPTVQPGAVVTPALGGTSRRLAGEPCSNFACPTGFTKKANVGDLTCAASPCSEADGKITCCDQQAMCGAEVCPAGYQLKPNAAQLLCQAATCVVPVDRSTCCDVVPAVLGAYCTTMGCPAGYQSKQTASTLRCAAATCNPISSDRDTCCDQVVQAVVQAACTTLVCPAGYQLSNDAASSMCASSICVAGMDLSTCCVQAVAAVPLAVVTTAVPTPKSQNTHRGARCAQWDTLTDGAWCFVNPLVMCGTITTEPLNLRKSTGPCGALVESRSALVLRGMSWLNGVAIASICVGCALFISAACSCWLYRSAKKQARPQGGGNGY